MSLALNGKNCRTEKEQSAALTLSAQEFDELKKRLASSSLAQKDVATLLSILNVFFSLKQLVEKRKLGILKLLRQLFGFKTEKKDQKSRKDSAAKEETVPAGRNGRHDYPGATKIKVAHQELKAGTCCPECSKGKLRQAEEGVDYEWLGQAPLSLNIFLLERLICHSCKTTFTATSPAAATAKTVDDSHSEPEEKVGRCDKNAKANATVACLRFLFGVPHYRLAKIQGQMGIGLPEASQYKMLLQVFYAALPIYQYLIYLAAQGGLLKADDTGIKILDWLAGKGPPTKVSKEPRKKANTSAIVSKLEDGRLIVLYMTGAHEAGHNMNFLLKKRDPAKGAPLYMCDGLAANSPGSEMLVIQLFCLTHARRQFFDIRSSFPKECGYVLDELQHIYKADSDAKELKMSPEQRLAHHQKYSRPVMEQLGKWLYTSLESGQIEANSPLGGAANYVLKRWSELNEFHHIAGVPLCNSETERMIKLIVTHRKNSLFYKTEKGAEVGSVIQSLLATCDVNHVNPFDYLSWLQEQKTKVKQSPELFLPWNFRA